MRQLWVFVVVAMCAALFLTEAKAQRYENVYRAVTGIVTDYSSTSVTITTGIETQIRLLRMTCTTACLIHVGSSAETATIGNDSTSNLLPANTPTLFRVNPGAFVTVIRLSSDGTLYITQLTR